MSGGERGGPVLSARDITVGYRVRRGAQRIVLDHIDFQLNRGEVVCLIGVNGSGKSTLLRSLAAMQPLLAGSVEVTGSLLGSLSLRDRALLVSVVLTERFDPGYIDVYTLVSLGRYPYTNWAGALNEEDRQRVVHALSQVGIEKLAYRRLPELSDGERQKAMIARAFAQDTPLIILDEPTAFLDVTARADIMQVLLDLSAQTRKTIILSTHDLEFALRSADRMLLIMHDGTVRSGAPEDLVLDGSFTEAFRDRNVEFDPGRAMFVLKREKRGEVIVRGKGLVLQWTTHALERAGYTVVDKGQRAGLPQITATETGGSYLWEVAVPVSASEPPASASSGLRLHSVQELIAALRNTLPL